MSWVRALNQRPWLIAGISISGLILAIAVVGFIELNINESVRGIVTQAIQDDLELEDRAEEVRLAVLDIRHYHDNLVFGGPTPRRIQEFDAAYQNLLAKIDALDEVHLTTRQSPTADELRQMAEDYYTTFRPAIELFAHDRRSFELASDEGLMLLARLERAVRQLERLGEQLADQSVAEVQSSVNHVRMLLVGKLVGHILIGATLALMIVRIIQDQQRVAADLANTLQIKSDFIADISHELRTPLTVLRANAEVALDLDRTCVHTEMLEEIVRESSHMTHLVEDLLFLARSDAGALPYAWETVNLRALLNDFAERAQPLVRKYGAHIRVHLTADGHVRVDRMRLVQALLILVDNAAKYGSDGNIITLTLKQVANQAQIEVVDNGPGIPAEDLAKIFERFYRVDQARSNEKESTGLGLAIAKSIIAAHGGRIEAESAIHQGATMRCYLPLIKAPNAVRLPAEARLTNTAA